MSTVVKRSWRSEVASGLRRRDRASSDYEAYVPDPLVGRLVRLDGAGRRPAARWQPQRDSNPCLHLERVVS